ncbi:MAG: LPS assembly protein LptD, partial [Xanthomonadaceae bacterium]|nr:LPS assembly protein LptD [Xanthomonadaceae bacterium]
MRPVLRLLPLSLSIAIGLPALAADKPLNWGLCPVDDVVPAFTDAPRPTTDGAKSREQQPTDIEGDALTGTHTVPEYRGNVALNRGDQFLGTDNLTFNIDTGDYVADGNVRYQDSGIRILAEHAEGNQEQDTHTITNIRYQLTDRRGHGGADSIQLSGALGELHRSSYSTCDPSQRAWEMRARQIDFDTEDGFGVARSATLRLWRFPVLYAPWFKFPIDDRRRTGLLYPMFGNSSRNGFDYRQPIYLNLAPNYDATLYPRFMSKRGFMLDTEFRYLYENGRGTLNASYMPNDDLRNRDRGRVQFLGYHNINSVWQTRANIAWVSDNRYTEDFSNRLYGMTASSLMSTAGVYGTGQYWNGGLMVEHWQLTDYTLEKTSLPYARLPRLYTYWRRPLNRWLDAGLYAETVHFEHSEKPGGERLDLKPYLTMQLSGPSWYIT